MRTEWAVWWLHERSTSHDSDGAEGVYELDEKNARITYQEALDDPRFHAVRLMRREVGEWEVVTSENADSGTEEGR